MEVKFDSLEKALLAVQEDLREMKLRRDMEMASYMERVKDVAEDNDNKSTEMEVFKANLSGMFKRLGVEIV